MFNWVYKKLEVGVVRDFIKVRGLKISTDLARTMISQRFRQYALSESVEFCFESFDKLRFTLSVVTDSLGYSYGETIASYKKRFNKLNKDFMDIVPTHDAKRIEFVLLIHDSTIHTVNDAK